MIKLYSGKTRVIEPDLFITEDIQYKIDLENLPSNYDKNKLNAVKNY
jgi:hypothetical protein